MKKEKYVDESWKEQASQEKDKLADAGRPPAGGAVKGPNAAGAGAPDTSTAQPQQNAPSGDWDRAVEVDFLNYVSGLSFQAMIFMGEMPHPVTKKVEKNLVQAKFLIDTLGMLKEKTMGNLNDQERDLFENSVYELQLRYVQVAQEEGAAKEGRAP
jgi:hypothetical protein